MHMGTITGSQRVPLGVAPPQTHCFTRALPQKRPCRRSAIRAQSDGATAGTTQHVAEAQGPTSAISG